MTTEQLIENTEVASANIVTVSAARWLVPSRTKIGTSYLVVRNSDGQMICDCESGFHRGYCWHVTAVVKRQAERHVATATPDPVIAQRRAAGMALIRGLGR